MDTSVRITMGTLCNNLLGFYFQSPRSPAVYFTWWIIAALLLFENKGLLKGVHLNLCLACRLTQHRRPSCPAWIYIHTALISLCYLRPSLLFVHLNTMSMTLTPRPPIMFTQPQGFFCRQPLKLYSKPMQINVVFTKDVWVFKNSYI